MPTASSTRLLKFALPLVRTHGFTRDALARSVLALPANEAHSTPLSDSAVSALFGNGDAARKTLINAWLQDGLKHMGTVPGIAVERRRSAGVEGQPNPESVGANTTGRTATIRDVLRARLEYNEPILAHLPEAFALLASPSYGIPPLDPLPALKHSARVADEACYLTKTESLQLQWYARRASLAAVYTAAELHQLTSPTSAYAFLDSLLASSASLKSSLDEVSLYSSYIFKSWKGIIKSSGIL